MLQRRPRRGERLENIVNWREVCNQKAEPDWQPLGVVTRVDGNICWYRKHGTDDDAHCFIWRFSSDGTLNKATRIASEAAKESTC